MKLLIARVCITFLALVVVAGCTTPPTISSSSSASPLSSVPSLVAGKTVADDLIAAGHNLDQAIAIGVLPASDPATACVHGVLKQTGLEAQPGTPVTQSFVPENAGLASLGSIAYILAQQARTATGARLPADCQALIGKFVIDGASDAAKLAPGIRLLR